MPALIDITKTRRVHKNLLLDTTEWVLPQKDLEEVCLKLAAILEIKRVPACADCRMKCEKCKLKLLKVREKEA